MRTRRFDAVIVGAGSAGSILAARLSEDRGVCLVEAGPDPQPLPDPLRLAGMADARHAQYLWHHVARANDLRPELPAPTGRVVGGGSAINTAVYLWALRRDLDAWAPFGGASWSYDACLPYFRMLESDRDFPGGLHGTDGPIPVERPRPDEWRPEAIAYREVCREMGYPDCPDFNRPDAVGIGPVPFNVRGSERVSAAAAFLAPARSRATLVVLADACARRIVTRGTRATAVDVLMADGPLRLEADEIILAAGAVGSPHLLLLSGIGPAAMLGSFGIPVIADMPGVGRNMRNHPLTAASWRPADGAVVQEQLPTPWQVQLRCTAPGSSDADDACLGSAGLGKRDETGAIRDARVGISALLMHAAGAGELRLRSADPDVQPLIDCRYLESEQDLGRMRAMIRLALELGAHPKLDGVRGARLQPSDDDLASDRALDAWLMRSVLTSHHTCGTARMGAPGDAGAVVDGDGRVRGIEALRVVDASIMPDCPRVNINATAMMVSLKVADAMRGTAPATPTVRASA